jgi:hypothetical protein
MDLCVENRALKRMFGLKTPEVAERCEYLRIEELYNFHSTLDNIFFQWLFQPFQGPNLLFSSVIIFLQTAGLLGRVISPSQGRYLHRTTQT